MLANGVRVGASNYSLSANDECQLIIDVLTGELELLVADFFALSADFTINDVSANQKQKSTWSCVEVMFGCIEFTAIVEMQQFLLGCGPFHRLKCYPKE